MAFPGPKLLSELSSGEGTYPGGAGSGEDLSSPQCLFGAKCNPVVYNGRYLGLYVLEDICIRLAHQVFPPSDLWFPLKSKLVVMLPTQFLSLPLVVVQNLSCSRPCDDTQGL